MLRTVSLGVLCIAVILAASMWAEEPAKPTWKYSPELLRPFWQGDTVEGESVLFIKDAKTGEARASVLFPIRKVLAVRNSVGDVTFEIRCFGGHVLNTTRTAGAPSFFSTK